MRRADREIKEISDIESIITRADVCRIAFADNNTPYIVTMNFGYQGGKQPSLFFHCAPEGRKLEMLKKNNFVCFEMDTDHKLYSGENGCDWGMNFNSVIGYGKLSKITDQLAKKAGMDCIMAHYSDQKSFDYDDKILSRTTILKLEIDEMTGKKR